FFEGFLPRKAGEKARRLEELAVIPGAVVCYESPHRVVSTLQAIAQVMPARRVALVRELTKLHEEVVRDVAPELARVVAERDEVRGECVIVIAPPTDDELASTAVPTAGPATLEEAIAEGLAAGEPKSALAKRLAKAFKVDRNEIYDLIVGQR
ncbi:MAG: 16S rRNA (cytidine(1402)-2'-O)-methyltransferase, partial [Atopobiaceae bacterium]|nr:16S rRNA (cytidine(1402)-2'-O)-methyltransferase [Atopobiaceae bacterium]